MDPAALGTLIIGLESDRLDNEATDRRRRATHRTVSRQRSAAFTIAGWLRGVADRLDRPAGRTELATR